MSKRQTKKRAKKPAKANWTKTALGLFIALGSAVLLVWGGSYVSQRLLDYDHRMEPFADAPATARHDLLYLSYLDSLVRDGRALPPIESIEPALLAAQIAHLSAVPLEKRKAWGLVRQKSDKGLNGLMRQMHQMGRLLLPQDNASLYQHMRSGKAQPGYLVFGQLEGAKRGGVTLVALLTHINWFNPMHSTLLYCAPDKKPTTLVHATLERMPTFSYLGCGVPGDNLAQVYLKYFRRNIDRRKKSLY